jgi:hypothetical protein
MERVGVKARVRRTARARGPSSDVRRAWRDPNGSRGCVSDAHHTRTAVFGVDDRPDSRVAPAGAVIQILRPVHPLAVRGRCPPLRPRRRVLKREDAINRQPRASPSCPAKIGTPRSPCLPPGRLRLRSRLPVQCRPPAPGFPAAIADESRAQPPCHCTRASPHHRAGVRPPRVAPGSAEAARSTRSVAPPTVRRRIRVGSKRELDTRPREPGSASARSFSSRRHGSQCCGRGG